MTRSAIIIVALVVVLGLAGLGTALAESWYVSGYVYFTEPNGEPVPCVDVYLYSTACTSAPLDSTETDQYGFFSFYGEWPDSCWVQVVFDADKACPFCVGGGYNGMCSDETSDCRGPVSFKTETLHFNLDQPNCWCQ